MESRRLLFILAVILISLMCTNIWANGSTERSAADLLYQNLGRDDYKDYVPFRTDPSSGGGLGTVYQIDLGHANDSRVIENFKTGSVLVDPNDWLRSEVVSTDAEKQAIMDRIFGQPRHIGGLNIVKEDKSSVSLKAVVPNIQQVLSLDGEGDYQKGVQVTLNSDAIEVRELNISELQASINNYELKGYAIQNLLKKGNMICVGEIKLIGYSVSITVDNSASTKLVAQLNAAATNPNPSLNLVIQNSGNGTYKIASSSALIAAVHYVKLASPTFALKPPSGTRDAQPILLAVDAKEITWKVPDGVDEFRVEVVGAGGNGGHSYPNGGAGGGGAGAYASHLYKLGPQDPREYRFHVGKPSDNEDTRTTWFGIVPAELFAHGGGTGGDIPEEGQNNWNGGGGLGSTAGGSVVDKQKGDDVEAGPAADTKNNALGGLTIGGVGATSHFGVGGAGGQPRAPGVDADPTHYGAGGGGGGGAQDQTSQQKIRSLGAPGMILITCRLSYTPAQ